METYWVPGVNHLGTYGRWAFAEFRDVYQMGAEFRDKIETEFNNMINTFNRQPKAHAPARVHTPTRVRLRLTVKHTHHRLTVSRRRTRLVESTCTRAYACG